MITNSEKHPMFSRDINHCTLRYFDHQRGIENPVFKSITASIISDDEK